MIDIEAIRKRAEEALGLLAEFGAPCGDPEHNVEVAGEAYTSCCDRWLMRDEIRAVALSAQQIKADIEDELRIQ